MELSLKLHCHIIELPLKYHGIIIESWWNAHWILIALITLNPHWIIIGSSWKDHGKIMTHHGMIMSLSLNNHCTTIDLPLIHHRIVLTIIIESIEQVVNSVEKRVANNRTGGAHASGGSSSGKHWFSVYDPIQRASVPWIPHDYYHHPSAFSRPRAFWVGC